jgi:hypothetical protein
MTAFEMYKDALGMALNIDPEKVVKAEWDALDDIWKVVVLDDGLVHFKLQGLLVRLCFKWIHKTGRRAWQNTSILELTPGSVAPESSPRGTTTSASMKDS